ncbi:MAG: hypothetical protein ACRDQ7_18630 [Haloechinothrix sp.]
MTVSRLGDVGADVTDPSSRKRLVETLQAAIGTNRRVVLVDAVLDRSSVAAMRASLAGAAETVATAAHRLAAIGYDVRIVAASTTAVLAPLPYQTPYGRAKLRQLHRYAAADAPVCAWLLPMLRDTLRADPWRPWRLGCLPRIVWPYQRAAAALVQECFSGQCDPELRVEAPTDPASCPAGACREGACRVASAAAAGLAVAPLNLARFTGWRGSPAAQRYASYSLLQLTPRRARLRLDHHLAPPQRVSRLTRRLEGVRQLRSENPHQR